MVHQTFVRAYVRKSLPCQLLSMEDDKIEGDNLGKGACNTGDNLGLKKKVSHPHIPGRYVRQITDCRVICMI